MRYINIRNQKLDKYNKDQKLQLSSVLHGKKPTTFSQGNNIVHRLRAQHIQISKQIVFQTMCGAFDALSQVPHFLFLLTHQDIHFIFRCSLYGWQFGCSIQFNCVIICLLRLLEQFLRLMYFHKLLGICFKIGSPLNKILKLNNLVPHCLNIDIKKYLYISCFYNYLRRHIRTKP